MRKGTQHLPEVGGRPKDESFVVSSPVVEVAW